MTSSVRVLFISHTYIVGINQGKLDAIASNKNVEVGLLVPEKWKARAWSQTHSLEETYSNIKYYPAKVFFNGRNGAYIYSFGSLLHALKNFQPDIIQIEEEVFSLSTFEVAVWARFTNTPLVVFVWENILDRSIPTFRRWTCQFVLDTARLIIAGNEDGKKILQKWGYKGKIEVMPQMGVDPNIFSPQLRPSRKTENFTIGYMGRTIHCKGLDILFAAAQQLRQQGYSFKIAVCGSGSDKNALQQKAKEIKIDNLISWKEKVPHEEVPQEMSKLDVLVLPSRSTSTWREQFGHVLIEAMSMGIPAIGSSCGEIPNVIERQDLVFPEEDIATLTNILKRMIDEPLWYREISFYNIDRVEKYYSHKKIAERLLKQWQMLLERK
jgi:glycosyltransferase involved in cell wall biosynthesis